MRGIAIVLSGRRVLIIEDEPIVAMLLEDMLGDLGLTVAGRARTLDRALQADAARCDAAVMDINLQGQKSYAAAERWRALACRSSSSRATRASARRSPSAEPRSC